MKKIAIFLFLILIINPFKGNSQNIENASFDSLCICAIDRIWQWVTSDTYYFSNDTAQPFMPNTYYSNMNWDLHMAWNTTGINYDANLIHYANSVKLFTRTDLRYANGDMFRGFIANGEHFYSGDDGFIDFSKGGEPFPYRPSSINGGYQFEDSLSSVDDFGQVIVLLKKYNPVTNMSDTIGYINNTIDLNPTSSWTYFEIPIDYYSNEIPDSIVVVFVSSSVGSEPTTLWVDGIHFSYTFDIDELSNGSEIIFPNPTNDFLSFSSDENYE